MLGAVVTAEIKEHIFPYAIGFYRIDKVADGMIEFLSEKAVDILRSTVDAEITELSTRRAAATRSPPC